jgi:hypothetical protein
MKCAICYEKFLKPSQEEFVELLNEMRNKNFNEIIKIRNFLITPKHNTTHTCHTPNCECIICSECWFKHTHNAKSMYEITINNIPSLYTYFKCPYCRQIDWKDYMNNVFQELQIKVLGSEEFINRKVSEMIT